LRLSPRFATEFGMLNPTRDPPRLYTTIGHAIYDAPATYDAMTRHGISASLFTATFH
jgi:hypothetical protein